MWNLLARLGASLIGKALPDRSKTAEAQSRINEAEVSGAPASSLRLWRSALGWILVFLFVWEVICRRAVIPMLFPEMAASLPPSDLDPILSLLTGMLGLGF